MRCQLIRAVKKCVRHILSNQHPKNCMHAFSLTETEKCETWVKLQEIVRCNMPLFRTLGSTGEGPATEGKSGRRIQPEFRSFNDEYCAHFFQPAVVREFHHYYVKLVYGDSDPHTMCRKLTVSCCEDATVHSAKCRELWERMRSYVAFEMLEQLKVLPFCEHFAEETIDEFMDVDGMLIGSEH